MLRGGWYGRLLVDREIPSRLIPFRGEFPLLNMIEAIRFREAIRSTMWIEDLPPKFLYAAAEGSRIARLEREFRHYLSRNGLKSGDFEKLEDDRKIGMVAVVDGGRLCQRRRSCR